jgi:membrane dipeptidase
MQTPGNSAADRAFHDSLMVVDGHCDTVLDLVGEGRRDFFDRAQRGHVDLPRLLEGGLSCQVMAMFTNTSLVDRATAWTWSLLETIEELFARGTAFVPARGVSDIREAKRRGQVSGLLAIEGGEALGPPGQAFENLKAFHERGVRLMTLTWSRRNALGRGVTAPGGDGLSDLGRGVVARMEDLGMMVDASHLSDEALVDLLAVARRPVVASHSNSRALCPHPRNLSDELAEGIAATGGLVALTFAGDFIDPDPAKVSFDRFMEHLEHMIVLVGSGHVGIGSDFDGWNEKFGVAFPDCTALPRITAALLERGYGSDQVAEVMGGSWLRVIGEVVGE